MLLPISQMLYLSSESKNNLGETVNIPGRFVSIYHCKTKDALTFPNVFVCEIKQNLFSNKWGLGEVWFDHSRYILLGLLYFLVRSTYFATGNIVM